MMRKMTVALALVAALVAGKGAMAQTPTGSDAPKTPSHQPGVAAKPAPAGQAETSASTTLQPPGPAVKLDPAKETAIRHLMDITEVSKMGENIQAYIEQQVQDVAGRALAPEKVSKFMETFSTKFNATASPEGVTDAIVTVYAKTFSLEDIQGLIQFYETPLGKRVVQTMPQVSQQSQQAGIELDKNAAIAVLRGMSSEYPEIKQMLPAEDGPSGRPAGPGVPPGAKPDPQK